MKNDPNGVTEVKLVEQGFSVPMLARFVVDGLVIAKHEAGDRKMDVTESRKLRIMELSEIPGSGRNPDSLWGRVQRGQRAPGPRAGL